MSSEASSRRPTASKYLEGLRPSHRLSIRTRLTALFVTIFGVTLVIFCAIIFKAFTQSDEAAFDAALYNHAVDIAMELDVDWFGDFSINPQALRGDGKIFPFSVGKTYIQVLGPDGKVMARSAALSRRTLPVYEEDWRRANQEGMAFRTVPFSEISPKSKSQDRAPYRMLTYQIQSRAGERFALQVAVQMSLLQQSRKGLITLFMIGVPLTLLVAALGGLYLSRRALLPVSAIIDKTKSLSAARLSERIPLPAVRDELWELSLTLNALLDRLQTAFESQERFIADASHELKTPLAILRGELDVFRSRPRSQEEISEFLDSSVQELASLTRIVEDLLLLARIDTGAASLHLENVRLEEVALEVISRMEPLARQKGIKIRFDLDGAEFEVNGDADLLRVGIKNLVENAIKFSPNGGGVDVRLESLAETIRVRVKDEGPGVPSELAPKIFERFYRVRKTESQVSGAGLGLAIAAQIARSHQGSIRLDSSLSPAEAPTSAGAVFVLEIPRARA